MQPKAAPLQKAILITARTGNFWIRGRQLLTVRVKGRETNFNPSRSRGSMASDPIHLAYLRLALRMHTVVQQMVNGTTNCLEKVLFQMI